MALMGLFSRRVRKQSSRDTTGATTSVCESEAADSEYVLPKSDVPASRNGDGVSHGHGSSAASSSKLKLPGFRRTGQHGSPAGASRKDIDNDTRAPKPLTFSSAASEADIDLYRLPPTPPDKKSLFVPSAYDSRNARSTKSLPNKTRHSREDSQSSVGTETMKKTDKSLLSTSAPLKKSGGLFFWRERTKSKAEPAPPVESFNLKSFRHVGPDSPSISPRPASPAPSIPLPPARPRANSVASESSQRISVAAFREAQARRSAAGSPSPSLRPPSALDLPAVARSLQSTSNQSLRTRNLPPLPTGGGSSHPPPRRSTAPAVSTKSTSSEESEEEESEPEAEPESRSSQQRTTTEKSRSELGHRSSPSSSSVAKPVSSARSEIGHGLRTHDSPPQLRVSHTGSGSTGGRSGSFYSRKRASASTSALTPNCAARRAAIVAAAVTSTSVASPAESVHKRVPARDTDTSESEHSRANNDEEEDEDDAPLATLVNPKRPDTATSTVSTSTTASRSRMKKLSTKPLIDISSLGGPPPLPSKHNEQDNASKVLSPSLNERLTNLTRGIGSSSAENLHERNGPVLRNAPAVRRETEPPLPTRVITPNASPSISQPRAKSALVLAGTDAGLSTSRSTLSPDIIPVTTSPISLPPASPDENRRIVPTSVRQREHQPSFSVTSRPRSSHTVSDTVATQSSMRMTSSHSSSGSSRPSTVRPATLVSLIPPGSGFGNTLMPQKPFASQGGSGRGFRGNSPSSSTGDSSSGRAPYTPRDGSDYGWDSKSTKSGSNVSSTVGPAPNKGHKKNASVTFEDTGGAVRGNERGRNAGVTKMKTEAAEEEAVERRRRERRRNEAKASIELGNVVNGRGPIDHENNAEGPPRASNIGPRMDLLHPMMTGMSYHSSPSPPTAWGNWSHGHPSAQSTLLSPQQFMLPPVPPHADANFLAAHERAMMIAKQTYQMAVAQQAMAAAAEEWERGSAYGGSTYGGGGGYNQAMGMGAGMGWPNGNVMFPSGPRSAYAGSAVGDTASEAGGDGWASRSVFGESFGPPRTPMMSMYGQGQGHPGPMPPYHRAESFGTPSQQQQKTSARPRTRSTPVDQASPPRGTDQAHGHKKVAPPSSWTAKYQA